MLTVVIVSWNVAEPLRECLSALSHETTVRRIVVVDNASRDQTCEIVAREFPGVLLIRNEENVGFARACNQGITAAGGCDDIALLNPDTRTVRGSLGILAAFLKDHPRAGAIGPRLLNPDGSIQPNGGPLPSPLGTFCRLTRLSSAFPSWFDRRFRWGREAFDAPAKVDQVSGACLVIRREALAQVGLLDELFFMYYEEVDWLTRASLLGWESYYVPGASVVHQWGASTNQVGTEALRWMSESEYRYFRKHRSPWLRPLSWALTRMELASHLLARRLRGQVRGPAGSQTTTDTQ